VSIETDVDEPSWIDLLRACQNQLADRIHTALPGIVQSYDVATQTATVQLAVQLRGATVPALADVPVVHPGGAAAFLHIPLAANDTVLVVFSEEDFGPWLVSGSVSAPAVLARHGLHAVAIPGLRRTPLAVTSGHTTLAVADELRLGADTAANFVALANLVDARISALVTYINAHAHSGVTTGPGTSGPPGTPLAAQASVAATKVKAV
jgi:hypothetical protein